MPASVPTTRVPACDAEIKSKVVFGRLMSPVTDAMVAALGTYCEQSRIDNCMIMEDGRFILYRPEKAIVLNAGMRTLEKHFSDNVEIERLRVERPAPQRLLMDLFPCATVDEEAIRYQFGAHFEMEAILHTITKRDTRTVNRTMINIPIKQAVDQGIVPLQQAMLIQTNKDFLTQKDAEEQVRAKPMLHGDLVLNFYKYVNGLATGRPIPVILNGRPDDAINENSVVKKKHYWIYSSEPGYGKTLTLKRELVDRYSSVFVSDIKNAVNLPAGVQWLVVDEYDRGSKRLDLCQLKALTSGLADCGSINKKTYGASYTPERYMQMVILANHSPYRVYADWSNEGQRLLIDGATARTIEDRFQIYCLDGDNNRHRATFLRTDKMTLAELETSVAARADLVARAEENHHHRVRDGVVLLDAAHNMVDAFYDVCRMFSTRPNIDFVLQLLQKNAPVPYHTDQLSWELIKIRFYDSTHNRLVTNREKDIALATLFDDLEAKERTKKAKRRRIRRWTVGPIQLVRNMELDGISPCNVKELLNEYANYMDHDEDNEEQWSESGIARAINRAHGSNETHDVLINTLIRPYLANYVDVVRTNRR